VKAAETQFLEIFAKVDSSTKKELDKEFLKAFFATYRIKKREFTGQVFDQVEKRIKNCLINITAIMEDTQSDRLNDLQKAYCWGAALGNFMGMISYGITAPSFQNPQELTAEILAVAKETALSMKQSNKKLPLSFIKRRVEQIARGHKGKLAAENKMLIVQIAAVFAA